MNGKMKHLSHCRSKWEDDDNIYAPIPRKAEITEKNAQTLEKSHYFPISLRKEPQ